MGVEMEGWAVGASTTKTLVYRVLLMKVIIRRRGRIKERERGLYFTVEEANPESFLAAGASVEQKFLEKREG